MRNEASLGIYEEANKLAVFLKATEHERDTARDVLTQVLETLNHLHTTEFAVSDCQLCRAQAQIMTAIPPPEELPERTQRGFRNYSRFTDADVVWLAETCGGEYDDSWEQLIDVYATANLAQVACIAYIRGVAARLRGDRYPHPEPALADELDTVAAMPSWDWQLVPDLITATGEQPSHEAYALDVPHTYGGPQRYTVTPYRVQSSVDADAIAKMSRT